MNWRVEIPQNLFFERIIPLNILKLIPQRPAIFEELAGLYGIEFSIYFFQIIINHYKTVVFTKFYLPLCFLFQNI